ncbi:MAG: NAD(P)-dependent oxidoreductase [Planctomycetota bacterium]
MRIVVTGGSGRIGSSLVTHLHALGHDVLSLDVVKPRQELPVPWKFVELADRTALQPLLEGADAVAHLGELSFAGKDTPINVFTRNTAAGVTVFQTASDLGIERVVYTSTCQVYALFGDFDFRDPPDIIPFTETYTASPRNAYGASKLANEMYAKYLGETHDLSIGVVRFPAVFLRDGWWVKRRTRPRPIEECFELGTYITIDDATRLLTMLLESRRPGCEVYHAAALDNASPFSLTELAKSRGYEGPPIPDGVESLFDCAKLREHIGWTPQQTFTDLMDE